jgi:Ser/Thr protein kinase RdoA (MazF antagonist)
MIKGYILEKITGLFTQYNLGTVNVKPKEVKGGLLHLMYKVETEEQHYAVKVLNPSIMKRETAYSNYILSEELSRFAFKQGVNAVPALMIHNDIILSYENQMYQVFPWIEGVSGKDLMINTVMCRSIGRVLSCIHDLDFKADKVIEDQAQLVEWQTYCTLGLKQDSTWYELLSSNIVRLKEIESKMTESLLNLSKTTISHRDLNPKNTLWQDKQTPIIIDWESTGLTNVYIELLEVALNWSRDGKDSDCFKVVISEYGKYRTIDYNKLMSSVHVINEGRFNWLAYNLKRSLGIECSSSAEQILGTSEVISTVEAILNYEAEITTIEAYIKDMM